MKSGWKYALAVLPIAAGISLHLCCGGGSNQVIVPPPVQGHYVSLAWKASTSSVMGYNVYRAPQSTGPFSKLNTQLQSTLTYTDNNVQAGNTYYYTVTAVDSNSMESSFSNEASATVPGP